MVRTPRVMRCLIKVSRRRPTYGGWINCGIRLFYRLEPKILTLIINLGRQPWWHWIWHWYIASGMNIFPCIYLQKLNYKNIIAIYLQFEVAFQFWFLFQGYWINDPRCHINQGLFIFNGNLVSAVWLKMLKWKLVRWNSTALLLVLLGLYY